MSGTKATDKQVNFALSLLAQAGYRIDFMDSSFKPLATMRERSGSVEGWLRNKSRADISQLIDQLKTA